ncbi:hypothetical protein I7I50_06115 [Histoplasma capsulatum G186AR]|uniref:Uncharacterized protein n=1 Tax=Ajellomyces capsulatus TaxID=5037 RepID=A0A8H7Z1B0_AJECA|nr:hypothetical protein I7I52_10807 [Histoplasma capsulatum]QSS67121.1 hypothetical protein I7I50_06115 [Histoplasma capsulatum G186AR]
MKLGLVFLGAYALTSVAGLPQHHPPLPLLKYEWCDVDKTCYKDEDCYEKDCLTKSKWETYLIRCGSTWWPHSCWTFIPNSA